MLIELLCRVLSKYLMHICNNVSCKLDIIPKYTHINDYSSPFSHSFISPFSIFLCRVIAFRHPPPSSSPSLPLLLTLTPFFFIFALYKSMFFIAIAKALTPYKKHIVISPPPPVRLTPPPPANRPNR